MDFELILYVVTFCLWTGAVGAITFVIVKYYMPKTGEASEDYFAGGRSLQWYVIAGSLMLTNLSSEQLVGANEAVYKDGCLVTIWWEAGAAIAMILTAKVFMPQYLQQGVITTSGFLGERYSKFLRTLVSVLFLTYYALVLCPVVLFTGSTAIKDIFELTTPLWVIVILIGTLAAIYAISGGLKAVAVSDCLNGVGLIIVGLWVPIAALSRLNGGVNDLFSEPERLKVLVGQAMIYDKDLGTRTLGTVSVPWHTVFLGMTLNNVYYWATNQFIVQRVLAAENLAQAQKGVLFAAIMKCLGWVFLCLPGYLAILLEDQNAKFDDGRDFLVDQPISVFPKLVRLVLPTWSLGLVLGILLGSVLSTFNSALNSASTMFALEIWSVFIEPSATQEKIVLVANIFGVILTLFSFVFAPLLDGVDGIYAFLQNMNSIISLPILTIFIAGILSKLPDPPAAKVGFGVGVVAITVGQLFTTDSAIVPEVLDLVPESIKIHYLHTFEIAFGLSMGFLLLTTFNAKFRTMLGYSESPSPYIASMDKALVGLVAWPSMKIVIPGILGSVALLVVSLQFAIPTGFYAFWGCWLVLLLVLILAPIPRTGGLKGPSQMSLETELTM